MSIQFSQIYNLVRTYQRVLNLDRPDQSPFEGSAFERDDRVSISPEARKLQQQGLGKPIHGQGPASTRR